MKIKAQQCVYKSLSLKDTQTKSERMQKNSIQRKARVTVLVSDKINFNKMSL